MNTNEKGNIGLSKVLADVSTSGFSAFLPFADTTCVDLIVANGSMNLRRIQIKYREVKNGLVTTEFYSVVNGKKIAIDFAKVDAWGVYCPTTETVYYLLKSDFDIKKKSFSFRIQPPKKDQWQTAPSGILFQGAQRLFE